MPVDNADPGTINLAWATHLMAGLAEAGVSAVVLSPGSRNTPLTLASELHPALRCFVQVDERSAAFMALGMAKSSRRPVVLQCTSGSAAANWMPAVVEASQAGIPLLLLTADRPWELQQCGANQSLDQNRMFGHFVRSFHALPEAEGTAVALRRLRTLAAQLVQESLWPRPGPVHVNLPLREPLLPADLDGVLARPPMPASPTYPLPEPPLLSMSVAALERMNAALAGRPGLILCGEVDAGEDFPAALMALARRLQVPVLADPLSGLRFGRHVDHLVLTHYDAFLEGAEHWIGPDPWWLLRFGRMPVSATLQRFLQRHPPASHGVVAGHDPWPDPTAQAQEMIRATPAQLCRQWLALSPPPAPADWFAAFARAEQLAAANVAFDAGLEGAVLKHMLAALPEGALLFCGNSMSIRHLERGSGSDSKAIRIAANRGLSGIDGNLSTLIGMAAWHSGKTAGLVGDLTLFHDLNGLILAREIPVTLVVLNDDGGGIFRRLSQRDLPQPIFKRYWQTPTGLDLSKIAALFGLDFVRVVDAAAFDAAFKAALEQPHACLIEVSVPCP